MKISGNSNSKISVLQYAKTYVYLKYREETATYMMETLFSLLLLTPAPFFLQDWLRGEFGVFHVEPKENVF